MTRKHFQAIADGLRASKPEFSDKMIQALRLDTWKRTVEEVVSSISQFNSHFDHQRFYKACGYNKEERV